MKTLLLILVLISFVSGVGAFGAVINEAPKRITKILVNVMLIALAAVGILVIGVNLVE